MPRCCGGWANPKRLPPRPCSWPPTRRPISPVRPSASPAAWDWADSMTRTSEDIAAAPLELVIERIRRVYRGWNRSTSVAQMRIDWDDAFPADIAPISHQRVSVGGLDGEWIAGSDAPHDKAVLYFHGGGFRLGSVSSHRELIARISQACGCRVLAINYRLAPKYRFPAPLEDALAAYGWMLDRGLRPENIALAGDSAGGNLVLSTMLALRERGLPLPAT